MTWRNTIWQGGYRWLLVAISALLVGILIAMHTVVEGPLSGRLIVTVMVAAVFVLLIGMHNWITVRPGDVRIGFWPFYRRTLAMRDIRQVSTIDIQPFRQYGGLGLKGLSSTKHGLLLGGYPSTGLKLETVNDRRYVVTFRDLDPIIQALARHGCTLSADVSD